MSINSGQLSLAHLFRLLLFLAIIFAVARGYSLADSEWNQIEHRGPKNWLLMNVTIGAAIGGAIGDIKNRLLVGLIGGALAGLLIGMALAIYKILPAALS